MVVEKRAMGHRIRMTAVSGGITWPLTGGIFEARGPILSVSRATLVRVLFGLCLLTLLAGCFTSKHPLLTEDGAVTPLPDSFSMVEVEVDEDGNPKPSSGGNATTDDFVRRGKIYLENSDEGSISLLIANLDPSRNLFLAQQAALSKEEQNDGKEPKIVYYVFRIVDDIVMMYEPPEPRTTGLDAALKKGRISYQDKDNGFLFDNKAQLLAAARIYAARLIEGKTSRYRIVSSPEGRAALKRQLDARPPSKASKADAAPPASAAEQRGDR